jgi:Spy/CpxP family protein refolding chaperone
MNSGKRFISRFGMLVAALMLGISAPALSQPYGYGGYGPGMMGPGMMGGWGMGPGMMGPGMMGGWGMGPGMMGGWGMGPGMMEPGMMGGYCPGCGIGPGMMYDWVPDLTDAQRGQIAKIQEDFGTKQSQLALKLNEEQGRLQSLWYGDKRDPAQIREQNRKIYDLQRQMMDAASDARVKMDGVLTKEQRDRAWQQGGWGGRGGWHWHGWR